MRVEGGRGGAFANAQRESGERGQGRRQTRMEKGGKQTSDAEQQDTVLLMEVAHMCSVPLQ